MAVVSAPPTQRRTCDSEMTLPGHTFILLIPLRVLFVSSDLASPLELGYSKKKVGHLVYRCIEESASLKFQQEFQNWRRCRCIIQQMGGVHWAGIGFSIIEHKVFDIMMVERVEVLKSPHCPPWTQFFLQPRPPRPHHNGIILCLIRANSRG